MTDSILLSRLHKALPDLRAKLDLHSCAHPLPESGLKNAAILIPLVLHETAPTLLFIKRTEHLQNHPGQVAFPGGHTELDDQTPIETAIRETVEETGISPEQITALGCLPFFDTPTGYRITPVVGTVQPPLNLKPDPEEVDSVFEVPLSFLIDPANRQEEKVVLNGKKHSYTRIDFDSYKIWGITAHLLLSFLAALPDNIIMPPTIEKQ